MPAPIVTGHESEMARRVTALDHLSRGRDVRITAELCAETRQWVQALADEVGYPDRQAIGDAYLKARRALSAERTAIPTRPALAGGVVVRDTRPAKPVRHALAEHVAAYAAPVTVPRHAVEGHFPCAQGVLCRCSVEQRAACPGSPPESHVHTLVEDRDEHGGTAHCAGCDTRWRAVPCTVCGVTVAAAHIARTGFARHTWHPEPVEVPQAAEGAS